MSLNFIFILVPISLFPASQSSSILTFYFSQKNVFFNMFEKQGGQNGLLPLSIFLQYLGYKIIGKLNFL
jgi:hypothetical protein